MGEGCLCECLVPHADAILAEVRLKTQYEKNFA